MAVYFQKEHSADATITVAQVRKYKTHIATAAGITLTLCTAQSQIAHKKLKIVNHSAGPIVVTKDSADTTGFIGGTGANYSVVIGAYESAEFQVIKYSTTAFYWSVVGEYTRSKYVAWTPTLAWTTGTPASVTTAAWYRILDGICYFAFHTTSADSNGCTQLTVTLPVTPVDNNAKQACMGYILNNATYTNPQPYIDMIDNTSTNRVITFNNFPTCTDAKTVTVEVAGWFEVECTGFDAPTLTQTWGTATPASITMVSRAKNLDGVVHFTHYTTSADANGVVSKLTITPPAHVTDANTYYACPSSDICVAGDDSSDYDDMLAVLDAAHNTESSRTIASNAIGVCADGKAVTCWISGIYEHFGWGAWTPTLTWTGTAPTMATLNGRYIVRNGMCYFTAYGTSTDGNGCTALVISGLPVPPLYTGQKTPCASSQTVDTTLSTPLAYIPTDEAGESDRAKILFKGFSTCTDAKTATVIVSGFYPVG